MTTVAGMILVNQIMPIIAGAVGRGAVTPVGHEDREELVAEGGALAAAALESLEQRGKAAPPNSIAFYVLKALKGGRRSYGTGCTDAMGAATALCGRARVASMDEPLATGDGTDGNETTLHEALADDREGPDQTAAREMDWDAVTATLTERQSRTLSDAVWGVRPSVTAQALRVSRPRVTQLRREVGEKVAQTWHTDTPLAMATEQPAWRRHLVAAHERRAGRAKRSARSA